MPAQGRLATRIGHSNFRKKPHHRAELSLSIQPYNRRSTSTIALALMALGDLLIYVGVAIFCGAFGVVIFLQFRLRHFVSKEKVHAVEDVSQLWKFCVPPKIVLNEKGRRLYRYGWLLLVICLLVTKYKNTEYKQLINNFWCPCSQFNKFGECFWFKNRIGI